MQAGRRESFPARGRSATPCTLMARNLPLFVAFRVFFNARFYYPVLGVLFLDLGLTLEQYALLNAVWAATIITLEVPSGALADAIGRKRMVVLAAVLMVVEMAIFAFAPTGPWLFAFLIANRIVSGAAEACASGADEALAYDSVPEADRATEWPRVLALLVKWSSGAFFVAMIVGAFVYDAQAMRTAASWIGWTTFDPGTTVRWPVLLTLVTAFGALACALLMREPPRTGSAARQTVAGAVRNILDAGRFVFTSRRILLLLLTAVLFDSVVRLFLTFASNYYRLIDMPAFANGLLGSAYAVIGFFAASLARRMAATMSPVPVALFVGGLILIGLFGVAAATPGWGVWVILPLALAMPFTQFFLSNYLNAWTSSDLRATVLSFRGVALNVAYGAAGIGYATLTASLRTQSPDLDPDVLFGRTLVALPAAFLAGAFAIGLFAQITARPLRR